MSDDPGSRSYPEVSLVYANPVSPGDIDAAVELGNGSIATLGLLPVAAYREAARRGNLLLAKADRRVVGYALYGVAKNRVRLTHLCVHASYRRLRVARRLVEHISERHADQLGIHARCRQDYGLGEMWIKLGFTRRSEQHGRGKAGTVLVNWWLDHKHPDLFTRLDDAELVRAAIDMNILRDLVDPARTDTRDVQALVADQVIDRLELVRTGALDAEIDTMEGDLRRRCTDRAQLLTSVRANPARAAEVQSVLAAAARANVAGYPCSSQDQYDLRHVAEAAAAGLNVFITRDEQLRRMFADVAEQRFCLRIMHSVDVVLHLDELVRAEAYRPAALLDTSLRKQVLGPGHEDALRRLADTAHGERPRDLLMLVRDLALGRRDRTGFFAADGTLVAAYCAYPHGAELLVPLVRLAESALADTLARQLLFLLRQQARADGRPVIRLADPHVSQPIRLAALQDGFRALADQLVGCTLDVCGTADQVTHHAVVAARSAGLVEPPPLRSGMPAAAAAEIERVWWPAKITDSRLPTYLIPIQQAYSSDLLGVPTTLIPRQDALGLSREHVYYRSPGGTTPEAPARLLWYSSKTPPAPAGAAVVACSQLDTVTNATPEELHSRFRHLGVWTLDRVKAAARDGVAQALLFTNTEILPRPIGRSQHRRIAAAHAEHDTPYQPQLISSELFTAIYLEGQATS